MQELYHNIEASLQTVYDPDFPVVDIYTLGLIYSIDINEKQPLNVLIPELFA